MRRYSEFNRKYDVIDFRVVSGYIDQFSDGYAAKKMIKKWADLGLIFQDENGNCFVNFSRDGKSIRSLRFRKDAVSAVREGTNYD